MFDPSTVCFEIKYPWYKNTSFGKYRDTFIRIWHEDPCRDGSDDSCDWFGHKRKLTKAEKALAEAIYNMEPILDNGPFYPDHEAHRRFQKVKEAKWIWRKRSKLRWHPRYHFWHWRIQIVPLQHLRRWLFDRCSFCNKRFLWRDVKQGNIMGSWSGASIWHQGCDKHTYKSPTPDGGKEGE